MTSYSIFVPESDDPDDVAEARRESFVHGAARAVLSLAEVVNPDSDGRESETEYAEAEWWHSARAGWEVESIHPDERERFRKLVAGFADDHADDIAEVAAAILAARSPYYVDSIEAAWYRAGYLFVYNTRGEGVSYLDHGEAGRRLSDAIGYRPIRALAQPPEHPEAQWVTFEEGV